MRERSLRIFYFILISIFLLRPSLTLAQLAEASFFGEIKSVNPAVIGRRTSGSLTLIGKVDQVSKTQELRVADEFSSDADSSSKIDINSVSFFRGGKGPGFTTEVFADVTNGKRTDSLKDKTLNEALDKSNTASSSMFYYGMGLGRYLGISVALVDYKSSEQFAASYGGSTFKVDTNAKVTGIDAKFGSCIEMGIMDIGLFLNAIQIKSDITSAQSAESSPDKPEDDTGGSSMMALAGVAFGFATKSFHFELGHETALKSDTDPQTGKTMTPSRSTLTIEGKWGSFALGYTGKYIKDGFTDTDKIIFNQYVYGNSAVDPRLENSINFSLGSSKGHTFSGSASYSSAMSEEPNPFYGGLKKAPTKTISTGASVKYGYTF